MPEQLIKEKSIRAWSGTKEDLLRLGEVIDKHFAVHRATAAACPDIPQTPGMHWPPWLLPRRRNQRVATLQRLTDEWCVTLEIADPDDKFVKDDYKRLLQTDGVKLTDAVSLTLNCAVAQHSCTVRLTNKTPGSSYRVQGEPAWARDAFASV